jgi:LPXTG-motif cell wall-anchored protein
MYPTPGYGQVTLSPEAIQALKPALAPALARAVAARKQEEAGLPTIAYVGIGVAAVGAVWWFFLRKKKAAA